MGRSAAWDHLQTCIDEAKKLFDQSPILAIHDFMARIQTRNETKHLAKNEKALAMLNEGPENYANGKYRSKKDFELFLRALGSNIR
jgi:hypothetical protein